MRHLAIKRLRPRLHKRILIILLKVYVGYKKWPDKNEHTRTQANDLSTYNW